MCKCCLQFNNIATIIYRQNVRYFANERDDGRYVTVLKLDETKISRYVIIPATGRDDGRYVKFLASARDDDQFYPKK